MKDDNEIILINLMAKHDNILRNALSDFKSLLEQVQNIELSDEYNIVMKENFINRLNDLIVYTHTKYTMPVSDINFYTRMEILLIDLAPKELESFLLVGIDDLSMPQIRDLYGYKENAVRGNLKNAQRKFFCGVKNKSLARLTIFRQFSDSYYDDKIYSETEEIKKLCEDKPQNAKEQIKSILKYFDILKKEGNEIALMDYKSRLLKIFNQNQEEIIPNYIKNYCEFSQ